MRTPYRAPDEVIEAELRRLRDPNRHEEREAAASYTLESLITLATRRLLRASLAQTWYQISRVEMASFQPQRPRDLLLWKCATGKECAKWPNAPQSWNALQRDARRQEPEQLPELFTSNPNFALMFLLAYPHRIGAPLVKALDSHLLA